MRPSTYFAQAGEDRPVEPTGRRKLPPNAHRGDQVVMITVIIGIVFLAVALAAGWIAIP